MRMWASLVLVSVCASGCATYLSQDVIQGQGLTEGDLKRTQFYLTKTIELRRQMADSEVSVAPGHSIQVIKAKRIETVTFLKGTACVLESIGPNWVDVSFEEGKTLRFGGKNRPYSLYGNWKERTGYKGKRISWCILKYGDKEYNTYDNAKLRFEMSTLYRSSQEGRVVEGRTLDSP